MTERLSDLLHEQATGLDVPPPPTAAVLRQGRSLHRRRLATTGLASLAAVAAVAAVGGGALVVLDDADPPARDSGVASEHSRAPGYGVVLGSGARVAVGDALATVPGTVHDMVFTSEGALVRSNENGGASDGSGPEALTLVRPDGTTVDLGTIPEGVGPATDPSQPLYALAEKDGDAFVAVLRDVRTGDEVGRVPLPDEPPSYWDVPPLALEGDHVFAGYKKTMWALSWRTGEARQVPDAQGGIPDVSGGRMVTGNGDGVTVVDVARGTELMTQPIDGHGYGDLSPDGRNLVVTTEDAETFEPSATLYSVDTGESLELPTPDSGWNWAWTPQGDALNVGPDGITVCDVAGGCRQQPLPSGFGGDVKPGGQRFES